ncbi:MAG: DUF2846 domain-containing protein [Chitinivibrionales bacterium]|nr:DUF2846 domain-containing protein [Chitinivibrionales bacterium]
MFKSLRIVASLAVVVSVSGCGLWTMSSSSEKPSPKPRDNKAVLVIMRTTSFGFAATVNNYLDGKLIGQTQGKCYFFTEVESGEHYLTGKNENSRTHTINFEPGKIYFLQQAIYVGAWSARTEYDTLNPQIFEQQKPECEFLVFDPAEAKGDDDAVVDMDEMLQEREKQIAEEQEYFAKVDNVRGF